MGVLSDVKVLLGLVPENTDFDAALIMHINSALMRLGQLMSLDFKPYFTIKGEEESWSDFCDTEKFPMIPTYIAKKVQMAWDPPQTSYVLTSLQDSITEMEWELIAQCVDLEAENKEVKKWET